MAPTGLRIAFHQMEWLEEMGTDLVGVPALAEEISERLRNLPRRTAEDIRAVRRQYSQRLSKVPAYIALELAKLLLHKPGFAPRVVAYELLHHHPGALNGLRAWDLEQLGQGMASWGDVDVFSIYVAGPVWRDRHVPDNLIHGWARSKDRWWRRAALVCTVPLNSKAQGGNGETSRTLQVCRLLIRDRDPMVVKALSWSLRELSKRDPKAVCAFVKERRDVLPSLVLREVRNKLITGRKNPKRKKRSN